MIDSESSDSLNFRFVAGCSSGEIIKIVVSDPEAPDPEASRLVGLMPAKLPVGIDFLVMPFGEPMLFRIALAYERATHHRMSPRNLAC
jgi:hypothetical protein